MKIGENMIKGWITEEYGSIFAERTQAQVRNQIWETLFDVLKLSESVAWNVIRTASSQALKNTVVKSCTRGAAADVKLEYLEQSRIILWKLS